jgi:hypothetical protein
VLAQDLVPVSVSLLLRGFLMHCAVNLNYQSRIVTKEVSDEVPDGMLTTKLSAVQLTIAK